MNSITMYLLVAAMVFYGLASTNLTKAFSGTDRQAFMRQWMLLTFLAIFALTWPVSISIFILSFAMCLIISRKKFMED